MALNETLTTNLALLAAGSCCVLVGGPALLAFGVFAAPVAGIGGWGLSRWIANLKAKNPKAESTIRDIQGRINQSLMGNPDFADIPAELRGQADRELASLVADVWPTAPELSACAGHGEGGFPDAVVDTVMGRITSPLFERLDLANYARRVICTALEAAITDKAYFATLQPHVLMETLNLSAEAARGVKRLNGLPAAVKSLGEAAIRVEAYLSDIRDAVAELHEKIDALLSREADAKGLREDNQGLRADIARLREDRDAAREEVRRVLTENIAANPDLEAAGNAQSVVEPLAELLENPQGLAERTAAEYLLLEKPDLRAAIRALQQMAAQEEDDFEQARAKLARTQRQIAAASFYTDWKTSLAAYERVLELYPDDIDMWNQIGLLRLRLGDLDGARQAFQRVADLAGDRKEYSATACGNMGLVAQTRGDLDGAMSFFEQALALNEALGRKEGMAIQYGNVGNVAQTRGDLDGAMGFYEQSLALNEALGRKEGMASVYGNMGLVAQTRGDLDGAMGFYEQALALDEALGRKEGMASVYGNMGLVAQTRGDLDGAMGYYEQSLALDEALGRKEGMANQYGNMGNVAQTRGDLDGAMGFYEQSLALNEALGRKEGMASVYGNMGIVARTRGDLDGAMGYYEQSLAIETELGRKEGMASDYGNMGIVAWTRGDLDGARDLMERSLALFEEVGAIPSVQKVKSWLANLSD